MSTKDETALHKMKIVPKDSPFANRTGSEFAARSLSKNAQFLEQYLSSSSMKVINFAMDAANIAGEHVAKYNSKKHEFNHPSQFVRYRIKTSSLLDCV